MALAARYIGGLPALSRDLTDADKAEIETPDGNSARTTISALREAVLADATAAGLEILTVDREAQIALLGQPGGGLPPLANDGIPYGSPSGIQQVISTTDGRALLAGTLAEQQARLGVGGGGLPTLVELGAILLRGEDEAEQGSIYPTLLNHLTAGFAALTLELNRE